MNYYAKRIGMAVLVFLISVSIAFTLYRLLPGGPTVVIRARLAEQLAQGGGSVTQAQINELVELYTGVNPTKPLPVAYYEFMRDAILYQDLGRSIWKNEAVMPYLFERLPWSIFISIYGLVIGRSVSLLLGAAMAYTEGSRFDTTLTVFTILNSTIPYYIVAIVLLILFGYMYPIFPTGGRMTPGTTPGFNYPFIAGVVEHGALPILSTFVAGFGGALGFRGNCIREMGKGYIRAARLRGINRSRLAIRYVGRNALLPIYTGIVMGIAAVFSSSIILETIFTYPAMGYATFGALTNRDYPLLMGAFILFTAITILGILVADFTYGIIDPRVKSGGDREAF